MRWTLAGAAALAALIGTTSLAEAAGGCGPGFHPNPWVFLVPPNFYGPRYFRPAFYGPRFYGPEFPTGQPLTGCDGGPWGRPWGYNRVG